MWGSYAGVAPRESAPPCVATVGEPADTPRQRTKNPVRRPRARRRGAQGREGGGGAAGKADEGLAVAVRAARRARDALASRSAFRVCLASLPDSPPPAQYVTGTSVIAFTYAGGVMMAADTLAAYGSTLRYKDVTRIAKVRPSGSNARASQQCGAAQQADRSSRRARCVAALAWDTAGWDADDILASRAPLRALALTLHLSPARVLVRALCAALRARNHQVNEHTALGFSGEVSDATQILKYLDELSTSDFCDDDGATLDPSEVHSYLTRVMYNRRSKLDPLWNSLVVAGRRNGESFLGCVNLLGLAYEEDLIATGFGNHLAMPLLRAEHSKDMSYEAAKQLMERALLVCYYRDKNSINKFVLSTVTDEGVSIGEPFSVKTSWDLEAYKNPQQHATGTW